MKMRTRLSCIEKFSSRVRPQFRPHEGGVGPHSGGESGGIEGNKQQRELLQQEGADKELEQYQDGE